MNGTLANIRRFLDRLYLLGGAIAALFLIAILIIIVLQMAARWSGNVFPGSTNYAGYCMAAASFFAFAYALNKGAHIRVGLFLSALGKYRRWGEVWCFSIASLLAIYFARYAIKAVFVSRQFNDISQGQDALPIWIPQISMAIGSVLLAIALVDNLIRVLFSGDHGIESTAIEDHHSE